ncbi:hypothetical protein [Sutcliffiella rhizosphaerae]|uniref:Uncharacterized protein n=1 Tax=Sutcliffiella rhizosphaerae TaxID=2880967 RepID=A0ABN8A9R9_9BACI|nr:hypothetical protein [Sutcliffiella rhizosphaerae]CAG9621909.1 hypothetical protein BACCIP111883_02700 [Sutcliffiella rhizosphaerae]
MYFSVEQKKTSHFSSNFWECNSKKIGRDVFFYSELEYDHWILEVKYSRDIENLEKRKDRVSKQNGSNEVGVKTIELF